MNMVHGEILQQSARVNISHNNAPFHEKLFKWKRLKYINGIAESRQKKG